MWIYIFVDVCKHLCRYEYIYIYKYMRIDLYIHVDIHPYIPHTCVHILQVKPNAEPLNLIERSTFSNRAVHQADGSKIREVVGLHFCLVPLGRILRWRFLRWRFQVSTIFWFLTPDLPEKNDSTLDEQIFFKDGWFNHQPSFSIVQPLYPLEVGDSCKRSRYLKVRTTSHSEHPRCFKRRGVKRKNILRQEPSRRRARGFHHKKWWGWRVQNTS